MGMKQILAAVMMLTLGATAEAQQTPIGTTPIPVNCVSGCSGSGGGGTVDQGTGGSSAWKVNFGGTAQPVEAAQSGPWEVSFTDPQHVVVDSGTVAATQSGSWNVGSANPTQTTGTFATAGDAVTASNVATAASAVVQVGGTYAGLTFYLAASIDGGVNYFPLPFTTVAGTALVTTASPGDDQTNLYKVELPGGITHLKAVAPVLSSGSVDVVIAPGFKPVQQPMAAPIVSSTGGSILSNFFGSLGVTLKDQFNQEANLIDSDPAGDEMALVVRNIPSGTQTITGNVFSAITDNLFGDPAAVKQDTPDPSDFGLVTRNIPSGTQAISAASLPLPTGAALESTASTTSSNIVALKTYLTLPANYDPSAGFGGPAVQATVANTRPTYTDARIDPVAMTTRGELYTSDNIALLAGNAISTGVGASGTGTQRTATLIHDGTDTALVTTAGALNVDTSSIAGTTTATGNGPASAGVQRVTIASDSTGTVAATQSGTWSVRNQDGSGNALASSTSAPAGTEQALIVRNIPSGTQTITSATTGSGTATGAIRVELPTNGTGIVGLAAGTNAIGKLAANSGVDIGDVDVTSLPSVTIGTFPDNEPFNVQQIGGTTVSTGVGASGTGTQRVAALIHDGTDTALVTTAGALNVDTSSIAGTATAVNNGGVSAGTQRVTIANDSTGILASVGSITTAVTPGTAAGNLGKAEDAAANSGDTGVAMLMQRKDTNSTLTSADAEYVVPAADNYGTAFVRSDHPNRIRCTVTVSTATTIQAVGGSCAAPGAGLSIYITDISFSTNAGAIAADSFNTLKYGTGGTCGTGTTVFWGAMNTAAVQTTTFENFTTPIKIPANNEVCWINSTAGSKFIVILGFIAP